MKKTSLYDRHLAQMARMVAFHDWEMPLHYGSQLKEHHAVRSSCGLFDVSHMWVMDLHGPEAEPFVRFLLMNDVARIPEQGQAQYSVMLNEQGGVVDDLILYRMGPEWFRLVVNAGGRETDLAWIRRWMHDDKVTLALRDDLGALALQGPTSDEALLKMVGPELGVQAVALKPFRSLLAGEIMVARTGYTGERGFEITAPCPQIDALWDRAMAAGIVPIGLGARDTLRLEAGYNLYGSDMDETTSPMGSGLSWVIAWEPHGRGAIAARVGTRLDHRLAAGGARLYRS